MILLCAGSNRDIVVALPGRQTSIVGPRLSPCFGNHLKNHMPKKKTTITISGDVRRATASVDAVPIDMTENTDGDLEGSASVPVDRAEVNASVTIYGEDGTAFSVAIAIDGLGTAKRKGRMTNDVSVRWWDIRLKDFKGDDA